MSTLPTLVRLRRITIRTHRLPYGYFATRWLHPSMAVITAHGELDAANAQEFVDYALRHAATANGWCLI